jgi:DNA-binding transcriptional regulator WhiA
MADGSYKDVSEIVEGDEVACLNLETMEKITAPVVETFSKIAPETLLIETEDANMRATPQHRYFVYDEPSNQIIEKRAEALQVGDKLILVNSWGSTSERQESELTEDQAYMLGVLLGDGHIFTSPNSSYITITDESEERLQIYQETFKRAFGVQGLIRHRPGPNNRQRIHFNSAPLARDLMINYPMLKRYSRNRYIEASIYREAPEIRAAFLRGLFDAEGTIAHHAVMFYSASEQLVTQVKHLLSYWGIRARVHEFEQDEHRMGDGHIIRAGTYYKLSINAKDVLLFAEYIGFGCPQKQAKMKALVAKQVAGIDAMRSKYILEENWRERFAHLSGHTRLYTYYKKDNYTLSQQQLRTLAASSTATLDDQEYITSVLQRRVMVSQVQKITKIAEPVQVYDFGVAEHHNYIVDGMLSHNSMGEFEKYIARSFYFWMVRFLRTKYNNVHIVFISHHTEAKEVTEEEFFHKGESGGTQVSSAYELALQVIQERYNPYDWNIYPFHFSDGDNLPWDNDRCVQLVNKLMELCNIFGYGEIREGHYRSPSTLMSAYNKITDKKFIAVTISDKKEVYPALRKFFAQRGDAVPVR